LSQPFARELNRLYEGVADMLEGQGVEQARYRLKLVEGGPAPMMGGPGGGGGGGGGGDSGFSGGPAAAAPADAGGQMDVPTQRMLMQLVSRLAQFRPAVPQAMMRDFLYRPQWSEEFDQPLPATYYEDVRAQTEAMAREPVDQYNEQAEAKQRARERALSVVDRPARKVAVDSPLSPQQWGEQASPQVRTRTLMDLKAEAKKVSQALGLDAVRTLVNQVAGDARVLAPVREAFVALEPALLRVALADPRFFGDDSHPARRFIEEVAQRSFKYNDEFAPDFEVFMEPVRQAVRELDALPAPRREDFGERLQSLQAQWQTDDDKAKQASEPGMQSVRFAQERQALADKIAWEFSLRSDLQGVPAKVADFLFRDWSLVIAQAQLTAERPQLDPGGYLAVVSDLLWSVNPATALENPARLFEVVPGLVATLRRGLDMLGKESAETQVFFDALMRYHNPVLRLRRLRSAMDTDPSASKLAELEAAAMAVESEPTPLEPPKPQAAELPWLGQAERAAAGFHEAESGAEHITGLAALEADFSATRPVDSVQDPLPPDHAPAAGGGSGPTPLDAAHHAAARHIESEEDMQARTRATLARLRPGDWVDLRVRDAWRRAQLTWSSDNGSLFMFVSRGGRPHSMTRRTCEKLIRARFLRIVDAGAVVDKAIRSLPEQDEQA
jgi:hypothetical protein